MNVGGNAMLPRGVESACRRSRDRSSATPICAAMAPSSLRSSAVKGSSDFFGPSAMKPASGRSAPVPAEIGTSSAAPDACSQWRSAAGSRAAGDCGLLSATSSGVSDHCSNWARPLPARTGAGVDSIACTVSKLSPLPASTAACSGCSAASISVSTSWTSARGSDSPGMRLASDSRISRASYSLRKNRRSSQRVAASR